MFSVILPTKHRPDLLRQALASALSQRHVDFEIIVVADGPSTDARAIATGAGDRRVRYVETSEAAGVARARNTAIHLAEGDWLAFLDDDDLWSPDTLSGHLEALRASPRAGWSCVGLVHITVERRIVGHSLPPDPSRVFSELYRRNVVPAPSAVVVARQLVVDAGAMDERFSCHADWDLWLRIAARSPLVCVPRPLVAYRMHGLNMSNAVERCDEEAALIRGEHPAITRDDDGQGASWSRAHALSDLRKGSTSRAAQKLIASVWRDADWRALVATPVVVSAPDLVRWLAARRAMSLVPASWLLEAEEWLGSLPPRAPA